MSYAQYENDKKIMKLKEVDFPFENIVLEGGGSKGLAYVGALQVFEEVGIAKNFKRICGASAGAIVGTLLAIGYDSKKLCEFLNQDLESILIDHRWGIFSLLPNLLKGFGWNPGNRLLKWFGQVLQEKTGSADITFKQILDKYNKELCIIVTNLSQVTTEYLHPKTTPAMPVRMAVRMSMSMPGIFQPVIHRVHDGDDIYVDGGFLCNYPVHVFDGWWLSMEKEDSYFKRFLTLKGTSAKYEKNVRFGGWNEKTLGLLLFSNSETEVMRDRLANRTGYDLPTQPQKSKLYKARKKQLEKEQEISDQHEIVVKTIGNFLMDIVEMGYHEDGVITIDELEEAFKNAKHFTKEDRTILFNTTDFNTAFEAMDRDKDGEVTFNEIICFVQNKGVDLAKRFLGYRRKDIKTFAQFLMSLKTSVEINMKRNYVQDKDIERTIGIDTDYIESTDFDVEQVDKEFLIESGRRATIAYLQYYQRKKEGEAVAESAAEAAKTFPLRT